MADSKPPVGGENASSIPKPEVPTAPKPAKPLPPPNPMWKYLGFGENFRPKLPSRNWTIFLTITGAFTTAVIYDKREKKRAQRKWCKLVEHIAHEPLPPNAMPRKLTVFLEGPPTDGLRVAQDHFKEYVKPILVASGLDWEFIQGRKEGDIRAELAEKIRNERIPFAEREEEDAITTVRRQIGIKEFDGPRGDIVIGRHTWKEYVRGLHEGWLGPLHDPSKPTTEEKSSEETKESEPPIETLPGITILSTPTENPNPPEEESKPEEEKEKDKPKKPSQLNPFILTSAYPTAPTPTDLPAELDPSAPISFPHILGFLNTPKRLYRFLNRRVLADQIGRETAAIILSAYRPYHLTPPISEFSSDSSNPSPTSSPTEIEVPQTSELQTALLPEEKEWHKSIHTRTPEDNERTWLDPIVLDPRIASRMRRSELLPEDEERAKKIIVKEEEIEGFIKGGLRSLGREGWKWLGFGEGGKKMDVRDLKEEEGEESVLE